jgi:hypothetical protein
MEFHEIPRDSRRFQEIPQECYSTEPVESPGNYGELQGMSKISIIYINLYTEKLNLQKYNMRNYNF